MDESPAQGRYSHSSGMRRALELPRVDQRRCVQVGTRSFNFPSSKRFIDEIGLAELPARTVRRCGTEWTFARIGEITSGADHIFLRSEEHTSELQSLAYLVCRLLLEKKKNS